MAAEAPFQIGKNIKKLREFRGYTQGYMAEQLGIGQKTYSNIEADTGKINKNQIEQIAEILEVHPLFLMSYDEKVIFNSNNHDQSKSGMFNTYNMTSKMEYELYEKRIAEQEKLYKERMAEQEKLYDKRIEELKDEVAYLRGLIDKLSK